MGESLPIVCSESFISKLNMKLKRLESCVELRGPVQGTVTSRTLSPDSLYAVFDRSDIIPRDTLPLFIHSLSL